MAAFSPLVVFLDAEFSPKDELTFLLPLAPLGATVPVHLVVRLDDAHGPGLERAAHKHLLLRGTTALLMCTRDGQTNARRETWDRDSPET